MKSSLKKQLTKVCKEKTTIKRIEMKSDKKIIEGEFGKKSNKKIISNSINSN
jgi:hypothetical protein